MRTIAIVLHSWSCKKARACVILYAHVLTLLHLCIFLLLVQTAVKQTKLIHRANTTTGECTMSQSLRSTAAVSILVSFTIIGGFLFGYDTGVVSGAMVLIADDLDLSETMQEVVVSATIGGAFIGAGLAGVLADKFGRRWAIAASSLVFVVGALVMALAPVTAVLIVGRLIVGLGVGVASTVVPVYIAEGDFLFLIDFCD